MPWFVNEKGRRLWYEERGQGPVLVLLHGWCMSSAVWRFQADVLSDKFRVVMPDLAGHGSSDQSERYDFAHFASDLKQLFVHLDLRDVLLAGWSMGAQIALQACGELHVRLTAVALISGTPCFAANASFPHGLKATEINGMELKVRRNIGRALAGFNAGMFAPDELDDPNRAREVEDILSAIPIPHESVALQSLRTLEESDLTHLLSRLNLPVLVINGDQDRICLPEASAYMAAHTKSTHLVVAGGGHALFLARPEEFNNCLIEFWESVRDCS